MNLSAQLRHRYRQLRHPVETFVEWCEYREWRRAGSPGYASAYFRMPSENGFIRWWLQKQPYGVEFPKFNDGDLKMNDTIKCATCEIDIPFREACKCDYCATFYCPVCWERDSTDECCCRECQDAATPGVL